MTTTWVFLSGAGLPAWIWDEVRSRLPEPSLVAHYPRRPDSRLSDYASAVLDQVPPGDVVLVAHSIGGTLASELLARSDQFRGVIGVAAIVPAPGDSFLDALPFPQRPIMKAFVRLLGTKPPEGQLRKGLGRYLDPTTADRLVTTFEPESRAFYFDRVGRPQWPEHTAYILTTRDDDFPESLQRASAARLGDPTLSTIDTGHLPMLEAPEGLVTILNGFLSRVVDS